MAGNLLPIVLFGGGVLLLAGGKKKKRRKSPSTAKLPPMVAPPKKKKAGSATWKKRQQAMVDTGYDIGPAGVDGKPGPDTRAAIRQFQTDAGIDVDGLWGPQTAAAMAQALRMAAEGLGRAAYRQIGSMLDKFKGTFEKFFEPGEGGEKRKWPERQESLQTDIWTARYLLSQLPSNVFEVSFIDYDRHAPADTMARSKVKLGDQWVHITMQLDDLFGPFSIGEWKTPAVNRGIIDVMKKIALAHPKVKFTFKIQTRARWDALIAENPGGPDEFIEVALYRLDEYSTGPGASKVGKIQMHKKLIPVDRMSTAQRINTVNSYISVLHGLRG